MKYISILLPTRGRPDFMRRVTNSAFDTAQHKENLQIIFYIDNDDQISIDTAKEQQQHYNGLYGNDTYHYIVGERIILSQMWNECQKIATADIFMHCGDDIEFQSPNWDEIVLTAFNSIPDKIAFVYGKDGIQPTTFGTHGFLHRNWVNTVGRFLPPFFSSDYNDTWINDVSAIIGRKIFIDIMCWHYHPDVGRYIYDQTHLDRIERHKKDNCAEIYRNLADVRHDDAQKLLSFINNFNKA